MKTLNSLVKKLTAETHYRKIFAFDDKPSVIIPNKYAHSPHSKKCFFQMFLLMNMLSFLKLPGYTIAVSLNQGTTFVGLWWWSLVWDYQNIQLQFWCIKCPYCTFLWPPPPPQRKTNIVTAPSAQILLGYDSMQGKHNKRTHRGG